jgi:hypothetical protein
VNHIRSLVALAALLLACGSPSNQSPPQQEPPKEPEVELADKPADQAANMPSDEVVRKICQSAPCVGQFARLVVLRDAAGTISKFRFEGDLQSCSHPPWIYYDQDGVEVAAIPEEPVEPGSARQQEIDATQANAMKGLTEAEVLHCPDAKAPK